MASGKGDSVKAQSYSGMIRKHKANTWLDKAYRDTTSTKVKVHVRLDKSNEGEDAENILILLQDFGLKMKMKTI